VALVLSRFSCGCLQPPSQPLVHVYPTGVRLSSAINQGGVILLNSSRLSVWQGFAVSFDIEFGAASATPGASEIVGGGLPSFFGRWHRRGNEMLAVRSSI
jgi:hypothetical protein